MIVSRAWWWCLVETLILVVFTLPVHAQTMFDEALVTRLDAYVSRQLDEANIPGAAVAVVQDNNIMHMRGYGHAAPDGRAMTPQTPLLLGSVSKSITALAVMHAAERGLLDVDAPVRRYLPWFRPDDERASEITIRHLLTHTSGFSTRTGRMFYGRTDMSERALELGARDLNDAELVSAPGVSFHYSNANYITLGALIEAVSQQSFEAYIEQEVFGRLGMHNSFASKASAEEHGLATGHRYWFGHPVPAKDLPYTRITIPQGFLVASAEDMGRYLVALLRDGTVDTSRVLSVAGVQELFRAQARMSDDYSYAMGWMNTKIHGKEVVLHEGQTEAFYAFALMVPSENWGVAVLVNGNSYVAGPHLSSLSRGIVDLLMGEDAQPVQQSLLPTPLLLLILLLLVQALGLLHRLYLSRKWQKNPEQRPDKRWKQWGWHMALPLIGNVALAWILLVALPFSMETNLSGLLLYAPDIGYLAVASACFALIWGIVRTILVSRGLKRTSPSTAKAA